LLNHSKIYMWNEPGSMVITSRPYSGPKNLHSERAKVR
jgi:hypothetical protein